MANPNRYREIDFIGARILQARELNLLQSVDQGFDSTNAVQTSFDLQAIYVQGALLNVNVTLAGTNSVTFSALDTTKPLLIFVRDRFESITNLEAPTLTLPNGSGIIYLNWSLALVTSVQDPSLVDVTTGDPTANMGELQLQLSTSDTSAVSLSGTQLAKNTVPIPVASYSGAGGSLVVQLVSPVFPQALAGINNRGGMVSLTGTNPQGIAVGNDDYRLTNSRAPSDGTVVDSSVRTPVAAGGSNTDGTPTYNLTADIGGISAAKVIMISASQTLEAGWNWLKGAFTTLLGRYNAHEGAALGVSTTHPFPTATQVGAVPSTHVGQPLGLATSHPAEVSANTGGYRLDRVSSTAATTGDPAFGVFEDSTTVKAALTHDGDVLSALAALASIPSSDGDGALTNHGALTGIGIMARVLAEHVGKVSNKNPHGLVLTGLTDYAYVDSHDAATLATAESYTNAQVPHLTITTETTSNGSWLILTFAPNGGSTRHVAFGLGHISTVSNPLADVPIALPASYAFVNTQAIATYSPSTIPLADGSIAAISTFPNGTAVHGYVSRYNGSGGFTGNTGLIYSYTCFAWL